MSSMLPAVYTGAVPRAAGRSSWEAGHQVLAFSLKRKLRFGEYHPLSVSILKTPDRTISLEWIISRKEIDILIEADISWSNRKYFSSSICLDYPGQWHSAPCLRMAFPLWNKNKKHMRTLNLRFIFFSSPSWFHPTQHFHNEISLYLCSSSSSLILPTQQKPYPFPGINNLYK